MARYEHVTRLWKLLRRLERSSDGVSRAAYPSGNKHDQRFRRDIEALEQAGVPIYQEGCGASRRFKLSESYRRRPSVPIRPTEIFALRGAHAALEHADHAGIIEAALDELIGTKDTPTTAPAMAPDRAPPQMEFFDLDFDDAPAEDDFAGADLS